MLERLSVVNWSAYEHADGPGTDVPKWLEALGAKDARTRRRGLSNLEIYVNHQGTAEAVSYEVVPFLVELVQQKETKDVDRLLKLLAQFSVGGDHANFLQKGFPPEAGERWKLSEKVTLAQLRERVLVGYDEYVSRLGDRASAVRANAALVLAFLAERRETSLEALRARLSVESDELALASAVLSYGMLGRGAKSSAELAALVSEEKRTPVVEVALGIAELWLEPKSATQSGLKELFGKAEGLGEVVEGLPWGGGRLGDVAGSAALGAVVETGDASSFSALAKVVGVEAVAYSYLALLFPKRLELPEPPTRNDLSAPQIEGLQTLFRIAREHDKVLTDPLRRFGLLNHVAMERIVGFVEPGALDELVDGSPLWLHARRVLRGTESIEDWSNRVKALGPKMALAVALDTHPRVYSLWLPWPLPYQLEPPYPDAIAAYGVVGRLVRGALASATTEDIVRVVREAEERKQSLAAAFLAAYVERTGEAVWPYFDQALLVQVNERFWDVQSLRDVLAALPLERRERILLQARLDVIVEPSTYDANGPTARVWRSGWKFVDLCPTPAFAHRVVEAIGKLFPDRKSPVAERVESLALERLASLGVSAVPALEEALAEAKNPHFARLLRSALEQAGAGS